MTVHHLIAIIIIISWLSHCCYFWCNCVCIVTYVRLLWYCWGIYFSSIRWTSVTITYDHIIGCIKISMGWTWPSRWRTFMIWYAFIGGDYMLLLLIVMTTLSFAVLPFRWWCWSITTLLIMSVREETFIDFWLFDTMKLDTKGTWRKFSVVIWICFSYLTFRWNILPFHAKPASITEWPRKNYKVGNNSHHVQTNSSSSSEGRQRRGFTVTAC